MEGLQQAVLAQLSLESLLLRRAEGREGLLDFLAPVGPRTGLRLVVKPFPSWLAILCQRSGLPNVDETMQWVAFCYLCI